MLYVIIIYALLASTFLSNKLLLARIPPLYLSSLSTLIGGLVLLGYRSFRRTGPLVPDKKYLIRIFPIALCITYGATLLRFYALSQLASYKVSFFSVLDPCITALLAYSVMSEKITRVQLIGIALATLGSLPLLLNSSSSQSQADMRLTISMLPLAAALLMVIVNRSGWLIAQSTLRKYSINPLDMTTLMLLMGGTGLFLTAACVEKFPFAELAFYEYALLAYGALISNVICSSAYAFFLKRYSITFLALAELITPLCAALYGWLFVHEAITWHFFCAIFLAAVGLSLFSKPKLPSIIYNYMSIFR